MFDGALPGRLPAAAGKCDNTDSGRRSITGSAVEQRFCNSLVTVPPRFVAPLKARRSAENIAYGYDNVSQTLGQWINSTGHRETLLMHGAIKVGVASAKSAMTGRTYWAMVIAGDHERPSRSPSPKRTKSNHDAENCRLELAGLFRSTNQRQESPRVAERSETKTYGS